MYMPPSGGFAPEGMPPSGGFAPEGKQSNGAGFGGSGGSSPPSSLTKTTDGARRFFLTGFLEAISGSLDAPPRPEF
jgi:hypothetical protein